MKLIRRNLGIAGFTALFIGIALASCANPTSGGGGPESLSSAPAGTQQKGFLAFEAAADAQTAVLEGFTANLLENPEELDYDYLGTDEFAGLSGHIGFDGDSSYTFSVTMVNFFDASTQLTVNGSLTMTMSEGDTATTSSYKGSVTVSGATGGSFTMDIHTTYNNSTQKLTSTGSMTIDGTKYAFDLST